MTRVAARKLAKDHSGRGGNLWWVVKAFSHPGGHLAVLGHPDFGDVYEIVDVYSAGKKL